MLQLPCWAFLTAAVSGKVEEPERCCGKAYYSWQRATGLSSCFVGVSKQAVLRPAFTVNAPNLWHKNTTPRIGLMTADSQRSKRDAKKANA